MVGSLNEMYCGPSCPQPAVSPGTATAAQSEALGRIWRAAVSFGAPPGDLDGPGALRELRAARSYQADAATIAPLSLDLVDDISLPAAGSQPSPLLDAASGVGHRIAERLHQLVLPKADALQRMRKEGPTRVYSDPALKNPRACARVLQRLERANLIDWCSTCTCEVGVFFVHKKNGKLRLILDGRFSSLWFGKPPTVRLASGSAFASFRVDNCRPFHICGVDICDAFYASEMLQAFRRFFGLPRPGQTLSGSLT